MNSPTRIFIVNNIKLPVNASSREAFSIAEKKLFRAGVCVSSAEYKIYRRSVDARKKNNVIFVYSVLAYNCSYGGNISSISDSDISVHEEHKSIELSFGCEKLSNRPLIVGAGPCGLFCALLLAENGYAPIIIERGDSVFERNKKVAIFSNGGKLDTESNIQFGAGGAGTFSDGKLVTRINDPLCHYVLEKFVSFGAPEEILYNARPHIGTDILSKIIDRMIVRIVELGGEIYYNTRLTSIDPERSIAFTTVSDIDYGALILAIGHSSRDTYLELIRQNFDITAKSFSVGMRIEHNSDAIDAALYGIFAGNPNLGRAEYNLSYNTKVRGVYTFCMCPGGNVVAAASEVGGVCVNGMSYNARKGRNSNSAVVCSIFPEDYGSNPISAIEYQRKIERDAFVAGGSNYFAPIITVGDFLNDKCITEPTDVIPTYMNGNGVRLARPELYLPTVVTSSIKDALYNFDKKISGFAADSAILTGAETRTSAPVRINRDSRSLVARGFNNIYPSGEGAGYAGGITSAAVDGIKTAIGIISRFAPFFKD